MEQYNLDNDIRVLYVTAASFPDDIQGAFNRLFKLLGPSGAGRRFFGISFQGKDGKITYRAAAEEQDTGESGKFGLEEFVIKKGTYISKYIKGFLNDIPAIGKAFQEMLQDPRIDPQGACIEIYEGMENVRCMVRLDPAKI